MEPRVVCLTSYAHACAAVTASMRREQNATWHLSLDHVPSRYSRLSTGQDVLQVDQAAGSKGTEAATPSTSRRKGLAPLERVPQRKEAET